MAFSYNIIFQLPYGQKLSREKKVTNWRILFLSKVQLTDARTKCQEILKFEILPELSVTKFLKVTGFNYHQLQESEKSYTS